MPGRRIPSENLLSELRRLTDDLGRPPFEREMTEHGAYHPDTYRNRWGGWIDALAEAGIDAEERRREAVDPEAYFKELRRIADYLGHPPSAPEYDEHSRYSTGLAYKWGYDWEKALEEAGLNRADHPARRKPKTH